MNKIIDMRSDTVTQPTDEMREAAVNAIVGDDVYEDDPTVNLLEKRAAEILGKEAAMFVPSGTFGNQVSLLTHTNQGDEVILPKYAHLQAHEGGAAAIIASVMFNTIDTDNGILPIKEIEDRIREEDIHYPKSKLIWLENAFGNGCVLPMNYLEEVRQIADRNNLKIHMDGARVFNAAASLGVDVKDIAKNVDSIQVCLSKGLCAPVGSIVASTKEFIDKARWYRKMMGGGMRQAGIIAGPALVALETMRDRLVEDHENAMYLAQELDKLDGINVFKDRLDINMVFFTMSKDVMTSDQFVKKLEDKGILVGGIEFDEYRLVTNNDVTREDINYFLDVFKELVV